MSGHADFSLPWPRTLFVWLWSHDHIDRLHDVATTNSQVVCVRRLWLVKLQPEDKCNSNQIEKQRFSQVLANIIHILLKTKEWAAENLVKIKLSSLEYWQMNDLATLNPVMHLKKKIWSFIVLVTIFAMCRKFCTAQTQQTMLLHHTVLTAMPPLVMGHYAFLQFNMIINIFGLHIAISIWVSVSIHFFFLLCNFFQ